MFNGDKGRLGKSLDYLDWRFIAKAVLIVFRENEARESMPNCEHKANADVWGITSSLRADIHQRAREHWSRLAKRDRIYFPYSEDEIVLLYFRYRKRNSGEIDEFEREIGLA